MCSSSATFPHRTLFRPILSPCASATPVLQKTLYDYIAEKAEGCTGKIYILLDEIQEVERWQIAINSLRVISIVIFT